MIVAVPVENRVDGLLHAFHAGVDEALEPCGFASSSQRGGLIPRANAVALHQVGHIHQESRFFLAQVLSGLDRIGLGDPFQGVDSRLGHSILGFLVLPLHILSARGLRVFLLPCDSLPFLGFRLPLSRLFRGFNCEGRRGALVIRLFSLTFFLN